MKLSEFINKRLKELGMKRSDLINKHDLVWSTLSTIDRGGSIGNVTIEKLALALQCNRGDIQACLAEQNPLQKTIVSKKSLAKQKVIDNTEDFERAANTIKKVMEEKPFVTPEPEEEVDVMFPPEMDDEADTIRVTREVAEAVYKRKLKDICMKHFANMCPGDDSTKTFAEIGHELVNEILK